MTISLLHVVVPTVLILGVLILYINSRSKRVIDEISELKTQLDMLSNVSVVPEEANTETVVPAEPVQEEQTEMADSTEIEKQDAEAENETAPDASAYNTGKSGKIYTKEELELLIKE